jgi:hypothetical protein
VLSIGGWLSSRPQPDHDLGRRKSGTAAGAAELDLSLLSAARQSMQRAEGEKSTHVNLVIL